MEKIFNIPLTYDKPEAWIEYRKFKTIKWRIIEYAKIPNTEKVHIKKFISGIKHIAV